MGYTRDHTRLVSFMSSPERLLSFPVYTMEWKYATGRNHFDGRKLNADIRAPKVARGDIDNISDGRILCFPEHLSERDGGRTSVPEYIAYAAKEGVFSEPDDRAYSYKTNCKSTKLDCFAKDRTPSTEKSRPFGRFARTAVSQPLGDSFVLRGDVSDINGQYLRDV